MAELIVRGPYRFNTDETECEPCSGQPYCTPFTNGDKIAFQIPADCCGDVAGCESLTEACIDEQGIELLEDATIEDGCVVFPEITYGSGTFRQIFMPFTFTDKKYKVCFCIEGVDGLGLELKPYYKNGMTTEYEATITESGNYCFTRDDLDTFDEFGLVVINPSSIQPAYRVCCMTVCEVTQYTAELIDEDGDVVTPIPSATNNSGQEFSLSLLIPSEIPVGCYRIKVTSDCDELEYFSQCLAFIAATACSDTLLIQYRNRNNAFGFDYSNPTYINSIRVAGKLKHPTFPDESSVQTLSDNKNAVINSRVQKLWQVSLNDLPDYVHAALAVARRHSVFTIDGVDFVCAEGDYAPNWRNSSQFAPVQFEAFDQSFDGVSTYCG